MIHWRLGGEGEGADEEEAAQVVCYRAGDRTLLSSGPIKVSCSLAPAKLKARLLDKEKGALAMNPLLSPLLLRDVFI